MNYLIDSITEHYKNKPFSMKDVDIVPFDCLPTWTTGKQLDLEHKKSISNGLKGHIISKETRNKIDKAILNGYNVCIWPKNLELKDVNDMINAGMSSDFIRYIIDTHTFRDLRAKLELNTWSKA